jgi:hypothetical protein
LKFDVTLIGIIVASKLRSYLKKRLNFPLDARNPQAELNKMHSAQDCPPPVVSFGVIVRVDVDRMDFADRFF